MLINNALNVLTRRDFSGAHTPSPESSPGDEIRYKILGLYSLPGEDAVAGRLVELADENEQAGEQSDSGQRTGDIVEQDLHHPTCRSLLHVTRPFCTGVLRLLTYHNSPPVNSVVNATT